MMQSAEIRRRFLDFFEARGHRVYPSSSLVPHDDPTVLLTTAGVQQFVPYFLGQEKPPVSRATTVQKCFRTGDLEEVGDDTHLTFFEMLGNFSFGDYFKREAIEWAWEFLTDQLGLEPRRLWITIFEGDEQVSEDIEAREFWTGVGIPQERIFGRPRSENWWGPPGETGPCGPTSEVYYDQGEQHGSGNPLSDPDYGPGGEKDEERFLEIWNLVFNQYEQLKNGELQPLSKTGVDTGMGLERTLAVLQRVTSVYDTDLYAPIFERAKEKSAPARAADSPAVRRALYILADHARAMAFLVADGVRPGNQLREYVLRRIIRRATREAYSRLGLGAGDVASLADAVVGYMGEFYGELWEARGEIERIVTSEASRFIQIYDSGMELLEQEMERVSGEIFPGEVAFVLHDTYGFPVEVTREVLAERGLELDEEAFQRAMEGQRERARQAAEGHERSVAAFGDREVRSRFVGYEREQVDTRIVALREVTDQEDELYLVLSENPFYAAGGGQISDTGWISSEKGQLEVVDAVPAGEYQVLRAKVERDGFVEGDGVTASINRVRRQQTEANHTATHILHWALRTVLGKEVVQAGSYVGPDRLRFDYRYSGKVGEEELEHVQELATLKITENQPVRYFNTTFQEARNLGALMLFGEKYGDVVRVVEIDGFSRELCGGTHVRGTAEVGAFKILSNRKHGADVYRIEILTGREALRYLLDSTEKGEQAASSLQVDLERLPETVEGLQGEVREAREAARQQFMKKGLEQVGELIQNAVSADGGHIVVGQVTAADMQGLRQISDDVRNRIGGPAAVVLAAEADGKPVLVASVHEDLSKKVEAGELVKEIAGVLGGGGGGGAKMAQGGGGDASVIPSALEKAREMLVGRLSGGGQKPS